MNDADIKTSTLAVFAAIGWGRIVTVTGSVDLTTGSACNRWGGPGCPRSPVTVNWAWIPAAASDFLRVSITRSTAVFRGRVFAESLTVDGATESAANTAWGPFGPSRPAAVDWARSRDGTGAHFRVNTAADFTAIGRFWVVT